VFQHFLQISAVIVTGQDFHLIRPAMKHVQGQERGEHTLHCSAPDAISLFSNQCIWVQTRHAQTMQLLTNKAFGHKNAFVYKQGIC
jgi:hypothetical protein